MKEKVIRRPVLAKTQCPTKYKKISPLKSRRIRKKVKEEQEALK